MAGKVRKAWSKNTERIIFTDKDGDYLSQSYLNGKINYYDKRGNLKKRR